MYHHHHHHHHTHILFKYVYFDDFDGLILSAGVAPYKTPHIYWAISLYGGNSDKFLLFVSSI